MSRIYTALIIILATECVVCAAVAGNTNDIINRERLRQEKTTKEIVKENHGFAKYTEMAKQKTEKYQEVVRSIKEQHLKKAQNQGNIKPAPQAIIFVSFSMPLLSLKQIIQDAAYYRIPVVIRGLHENSFKKTITKVFDLVKENNKGGVSINPVWFRKHEIKTVPAVVINQESEASDDGARNFDVVYGNIPLKRALTIIAERGDSAKVAQDILVGGKRR